MIKNQVLFLGLLPSIFVFLSACSSDQPPRTTEKIIPVKGDPLTFLKNTATQTEGLPASLFEENDSWNIQINGFYTEEQTQYEDQEEVLKQNKAPSEEALISEDVLPLISLIKDEMGGLTLEPNKDKGIRIHLKKEKDLVKVTKISLMGEIIRINDFKVHHYSVKEGTQIFSILLSFLEGPNRFLLNFVLVPEQERTLMNLLSKTYNYMFGPGVPYRWSKEKTVTATVCNPNADDKTVQWTQSAGVSWLPVLENRLRFETQVETNPCPPFSDLNTHSIVHVKDWIEVYGDGIVYAQTSLVVDHYNYEIIDSDIFIPEADWDEALGGPGSFQANIDNPKLAQRYTRTMKHEIGHFFGMHHQFKSPSIMDYSGTEDITDYDKNAMHELYEVLEEDSVVSDDSHKGYQHL